jgi:hypothetical protein
VCVALVCFLVTRHWRPEHRNITKRWLSPSSGEVWGTPVVPRSCDFVLLFVTNSLTKTTATMFKYLQGTTPTGTGCMFLASVGAFLFGFDNGWWGTILGSQRFLSDYGSCIDVDGVSTCNLTTAQLSAGSSVQSGGISESIDPL